MTLWNIYTGLLRPVLKHCRPFRTQLSRYNKLVKLPLLTKSLHHINTWTIIYNAIFTNRCSEIRCQRSLDVYFKWRYMVECYELYSDMTCRIESDDSIQIQERFASCHYFDTKFYSSICFYDFVVIHTLPCSMELYISYFIDPWFGIEIQILIISASLSLLSTNL